MTETTTSDTYATITRINATNGSHIWTYGINQGNSPTSYF
jgi:hypothetical protein